MTFFDDMTVSLYVSGDFDSTGLELLSSCNHKSEKATGSRFIQQAGQM